MGIPTLAPGQTVSHYDLLEKIGEGGMGVVYRARDKHLKRDVAVKILPPGVLGSESARRRFRREALALSRLNHPNIEIVHDFDAHEGVDFLVMEYIAGTTLTHKMAAGALPEKEVVELGTQLASGLIAAHEKHVCHRDIKPGNLRLTLDGRLKILDFGLATLSPPKSGSATTETLTAGGGMVGTVPYAAPEQLRGQPPDPRSDIYSAGVVLYEMITGQRPFRARTITALIEEVLHVEPTPPSGLMHGLSPGLEELILKCLEKDPGRRYQSAKELLVDLERLANPSLGRPAPRPRRHGRGARILAGGVGIAALLLAMNVDRLQDRLTGGSPRAPLRALAVLPLKDMTGVAGQDYFVDGMTESLITELSKVSALRITSGQSVMGYKGSTIPLTRIARTLGVDAVVEGSVRRSGDRVRVTAQLIDAATDKCVWADSFDSDLGDVLAIHAEIARAIVRDIEVVLTPEEEARLNRNAAVDPKALDAYLLGRYHHFSLREEEAVTHYLESIAIDPLYAPAHAALASCYSALGHMHKLPPRDAYLMARQEAMRAVELDDALAEGYMALGTIALEWEWDWAGSERALARAVQLNPSSARGHNIYSRWLMCMGRFNASIDEITEARALDPLSAIINAAVAERLYYARQFERAADEARRTLAIFPGYALATTYLGFCQVNAGAHEDSIRRFQETGRLEGIDPDHDANLGYAYARAGMTRNARKIVENLKADATRGLAAESDIALIYMALGERQTALDWLEVAFGKKESQMIYLKVAPYWDPLREESRFRDLLRRMQFL